MNTLNINRTDIVKFENLSDAIEAANRRAALNRGIARYFVYLGDVNDPRPYWLVDKKTASKLAAAGYERA